MAGATVVIHSIVFQFWWRCTYGAELTRITRKTTRPRVLQTWRCEWMAKTIRESCERNQQQRTVWPHLLKHPQHAFKSIFANECCCISHFVKTMWKDAVFDDSLQLSWWHVLYLLIPSLSLSLYLFFSHRLK